MITHFRFDSNREKRIFEFADASLQLYNLLHGLKNYVKHAANDLLALFAGFLSLVFAVIAVPVLFLLFFILSLGLVIGIVVLKAQQKRNFAVIADYDRKQLIELHVRLRHSVKRIECLKSSRLLFVTPIVGYLMRTYFEHISAAERFIKQKAYPDLNKPRQNPTIHPYNPSDPWQCDMSDLMRYEDQPIINPDPLK